MMKLNFCEMFRPGALDKLPFITLQALISPASTCTQELHLPFTCNGAPPIDFFVLSYCTS